QAEPGRDASRLGFARIPAGRPVPLLEPGEARDVGLGRALLHREAELLEALGHLLEPAGLQDVGEGRVRLGLASSRLLPQVAEPARTTACPASGGSSPAMTLSRLVLPA